MSKAWEHFPMFEERPESVKTYTEAERELLEAIVAQQVADLLSSYGNIRPVEIDNASCNFVDGTQTFMGITLDTYVMENDHEIVIGQFPSGMDGYITIPGAHSIEIVTEDDIPVREIAVWDPSLDVEVRVHDYNRQPLQLPYLQELHEALIVMDAFFNLSDEANIYPLATTEYPVQYIEPEFEALIEQIR